MKTTEEVVEHIKGMIASEEKFFEENRRYMDGNARDVSNTRLKVLRTVKTFAES